MAIVAPFVLAACKPSSLVDVSNAPNTVIDPSQVKTASAAVQIYNSAVGYMAYPVDVNNYGGGVLITGLLTDELQATDVYFSTNSYDDVRMDSAGGWGYGLYRAIHNARVQQLQARQALTLYAPNAPKAWQGQLYANEAYTILFFAEWFCSGIPLTEVPLVGPQTQTRGFTTEEMLTRAVALFDSAIVAGADSAQFVNLARVGKGRALLALGQFAVADTVVQSVPTDFIYNIQFNPAGVFTRYLTNWSGDYRAQDHEGGSPLVWSTDPRTGIMILPDLAGPMLWPAKYYITPSGTLDPTLTGVGAPVRLADGLEARLIQAEAELAANNSSWLSILNTLRAICVGSAACAPVPGITTTNLPDTLTDPGSATARLDLVMQERAMWLYMTGHREGDLRRLAHVYHRDPTTLWPTGTVVAPAFPPLYYSDLPENNTTYGSDMVLTPEPTEMERNSLYGGCYDREP